MAIPPPKNNISIKNDLVLFYLNNEQTCMIQASDYDIVRNFKWRAVKSQRCWYAKTTVGKGNGRTDLSMHRLIAQTPYGMVCHHKNRNSMDNRRVNLANMEKDPHDFLHKNNNLIIKRDPNYQEPDQNTAHP